MDCLDTQRLPANVKNAPFRGCAKSQGLPGSVNDSGHSYWPVQNYPSVDWINPVNLLGLEIPLMAFLTSDPLCSLTSTASSPVVDRRGQLEGHCTCTLMHLITEAAEIIDDSPARVAATSLS
jgi:hypothetical protein